MKVLKLLLLGFLFFTEILKAQTDFRPGYVFTNSGDTLFGQIDYRGDLLMGSICKFKNPDNKIVEYSPNDIAGYRFINSKYFVSKSVKTGNETKQVFLEYLIIGLVDIYYYKDDGEHYLVDINHDICELKTIKTEEKIENQTYIKEKREYVGYLKILFNKSPSISKKVENLSLSQISLIKIANAYQKEVCPDQKCIIYEKKFPKRKNTFGVVLGMNGLFFSKIKEYTED
jgi:hypothetical protein